MNFSKITFFENDVIDDVTDDVIDTRHYHKRNQQVIAVRKRGHLPIFQVSLEIRPKWGWEIQKREKIFDPNIRTSNTLT